MKDARSQLVPERPFGRTGTGQRRDGYAFEMPHRAARNSAMSANRPFAIVTGASTGIGLELAKCCAQDGFDFLIAADEPEIDNAAVEIRRLGTNVEAVQANILPVGLVAKRHRKQAEPRSARG
jgi:hypothetical protein